MIREKRRKRPKPTPDRLRQLFSYNPETGVLTWKERPTSDFFNECGRQNNVASAWNSTYAGSVAFTRVNDQGYLVAEVDCYPLRAHRVAWAVHYGEWPKSILDHKNGDRKDNRLSNLRAATQSQNMRNRRPWKKGASKYLGVFRAKEKWCAKICHHGTRYHIGTFPTEDAAAIAYNFFAKRIHKQFARLNKVKRDPFDGENEALAAREKYLKSWGIWE